MQGSMSGNDVFGRNLSGTHPFNFNLANGGLQCTSNMFVCQGTLPSNPAVKLINGNVQCESCHDPHVQSIDPVAQQFLVMNNANSAMCVTCHVTNPGGQAHSLHAAAAVRSGKNPSENQYTGLTGWSKSAHALAVNKTGKGATIGSYRTVRENGCLSCHAPHRAAGGQELLAGPTAAVPNMDAATQNCINCHNGGSNLSPAIPNEFAEFAKTGHPFPTGSNKHLPGESPTLDNNRHASCVDCHDPHASVPTGSFAGTSIRPPQTGAVGVSALDGITPVIPALNQYETCLRCHGVSAGKQALAVFGYHPMRSIAGDPLNVIPQLNSTAKSSHPVMHDRKSPLPQPSLLKSMWNLDGHTPGRPLGARLLCTDCHNSDDNREFGGNGPNGPHGSQYSHILERRYEFSQVAPGTPPAAGPGTAVLNLLPPVTDPAAHGPYSLCAKCHDLANILSNASFSKHGLHISAGFSCSVCHTPHGMGSNSANVSGDRMVDFDLKVVAPNDSSSLAPISYNRAANTCTLKCHNFNHNADGTVTRASNPKAAAARRN
jgi:nitrate/TMAO reductase-like tetraheme cytochrome c subunit